MFVDAVLWLVRAGAPWRDLPKEFGNWNSVFQRFRRWAKKGVWKSLFNALVEDPDFEYPRNHIVIVDEIWTMPAIAAALRRRYYGSDGGGIPR